MLLAQDSSHSCNSQLGACRVFDTSDLLGVSTLVEGQTKKTAMEPQLVYTQG